MKCILVTGGAGFVGSNFIKYVLDTRDDYFIVNLDKITYAGNLGNLNDIDRSSYDFYKGDIRDSNLLDEIFNQYRIEYIVNFAAESHVDRSLEDSRVFLKTNIIGVQSLMNICLKYNESKKYNCKFLQISTDEVYGDRKGKEPADEETEMNPSNPYSASKASAEMLVKSYGRSFGLKYNIVRPSNNFGPRQHNEKLIPLTISNVLKRKKVPIYGDGCQRREWTYVEDNCRAILKVLESEQYKEIYNIGSGQLIKNIDIVKIIIENLKLKTKDEKLDESLIEFVDDRPGHDREYKLNSSKIIKKLNMKFEYDFGEGIGETLDWYLSKN